MATTRERLKYYFRKYALPTEEQYAELIDAFVHKDEDTLSQEKINGLTEALQGKVTSTTYEAFVAEVQEFMSQNGNSNNALNERLQTAEASIQDQKSRIQTLEGKQDPIVDSVLNAESNNAIRNSTVTEALNALREEMSPSNTSGNFVKQITDLDNYSDAENGEIVQYIGQTGENYTRGFFYERKIIDNIEVGDNYITPTSIDYEVTNGAANDIAKFKTAVLGKKFVDKGEVIECWCYNSPATIIIGEPKVGSLRLNLTNGYVTTINSVEPSTVEGKILINGSELWEKGTKEIYESGDGTKIILSKKIEFANYGLTTPPYRYNDQLGCVYLYEGDKTQNRATQVNCTYYQARTDIKNSSWENVAVSPCVH